MIQPRGESRHVDAGGLRLHLLGYGEGPPLLIVPGITSPAITWEFVAEELAADFRVWVLDVRGRGLSDRADDYGLPAYAADVGHVLAGLGLDRPVVLGHSMGARIVAAFGALHPDAARALVVADPPLAGPGRPSYPSPLEFYLEPLRRSQAGELTAEEVGRDFPGWSEEARRIRAEWLATCDETAVAETWHNFDREDFFAYWRRLEPPVLFVYGGASPAVDEGGLRDVVETNPDAEVACIDGAGHMIPWDDLPRFLAAVRAFLA